MSQVDFVVNRELLIKARQILGKWPEIYVLLGGSCAGKSTVCSIISKMRGIAIYDMDSHIYDSYMGRYNRERHPASKRWFSAPNPLAWVLSLTAEQFDALNRATTAEYLDLLADDLAERAPAPLLVDGGFTHPSLLVEVLALGNLFCIDMPEADRVEIWENAEDRAMMRDWIGELPDPGAMWRKFLGFDSVIARTLAKESRAYGVPMVLRTEDMSADELANRVLRSFGL